MLSSTISSNTCTNIFDGLVAGGDSSTRSAAVSMLDYTHASIIKYNISCNIMLPM